MSEEDQKPGALPLHPPPPPQSDHPSTSPTTNAANASEEVTSSSSSSSQQQRTASNVAAASPVQLESGNFRNEVEVVDRRASPYGTISNYEMMIADGASDSILDDRTIDAAAVEEILDDDAPLPLQAVVEGSPNSSTHPNNYEQALAQAQALPVHVVANNIIPEVEPEVDIEEVRVVHDASRISAVSALTWTSTNTYSSDQYDTKLPPVTPCVAAAACNGGENGRLRYSPITAPPSVPRQPIIPQYRGVSAGTTSTTAAVVMKTPNMLRDHATTNNLLMSEYSTCAGNTDRMDVDVSPALVATHEDDLNRLPDYKDQARPRIPSGSPLSSRNVSDNTGPSNNTAAGSNPSSNHIYSRRQSSIVDVDDEHIPVVDAILVPAERLAAEEQMEEALQQRLRYSSRNITATDQPATVMSANSNSSGGSTLTTSRSSNSIEANVDTVDPNIQDNNPTTGTGNNNNNTDNASRSKSSENANMSGPPISERRFWITIIVTALLLNSMLVAGAVVGGFCAAGKCSSSNSKAISISDGKNAADNKTVSMVPTPTPSRPQQMSATPTVVVLQFKPGPTEDTGDFLPPSSTLVPTSPSPTFIEGGTASPTVSRASVAIDTGVPSQSAVPSPSFTLTPGWLGTLSSFPSRVVISELFPDTLSPYPTASMVPEKGNTVDPNNGRIPNDGKDVMVTLAPTQSPVVSTTTKPSEMDHISTNENDGISLMIMIPVLFGIEAMILAGLIWYYRRWKSQKQLFYTYDSVEQPHGTNTVRTTSTLAALSANGIADQRGCNTSSSSSSSSAMPLPSIPECYSEDQYSV
jgi:hypothetical protein